jgi:hypothetical protein
VTASPDANRMSCFETLLYRAYPSFSIIILKEVELRSQIRVAKVVKYYPKKSQQ